MAFQFNGLELGTVHEPSSVGEVGERVRAAAASGRGLYPIAGRTMLDLGLPPRKPGDAVDLRKLDQVIDYPARDMTITVQAGITISRLQEILRRENQRLPIGVPFPDRATLGGAVACNVSGPRRLGFGTLRDYVIGITVVNDRGHEAKAGGRVVKNVAGYDLCKLYTGSLGTLGIITQLTLKVRPAPETSTLLVFGCAESGLAPLLERVYATRTRPACVSVLGPRSRIEALLGPGWEVIVGFEDNAEAVAWQVRQLREELAGSGSPCLGERSGAEAEFLWRALTDYPLSEPAAVSFKANLLPGAVARFCTQAGSTRISLLAHAGNGIVLGHLPEGSFEQAKVIVDSLRAAAVADRGNLVLTRCPTEWKRTLGVWGQPRGDWALMRAVKAKLDPADVFNPGRLFG